MYVQIHMLHKDTFLIFSHAFLFAKVFGIKKMKASLSDSHKST